jgi:pimeloyl-ACP methyl ester carboxylesterase
MYYEIIGEGRPILMLHGFYPDHRLMTGCLEPVFQNRPGWQRIYLDLPGMGQSPAEDGIDSSDKVLALLLEFVDRLIPGQPFALAGESYGGYLARGIIHRRPEWVDGLLLICPAIIANHSKRTLPPRVTLVEDPALLATLTKEEAAEFASMAVVQSDRNWTRYRDEIWTGVKIANTPFLERLRQRFEFSFDPDKLARPFTKPTLMLLGRQDTSTGYRDAWPIMEQYPRATFAVLDKAGHNLQIEQADLFTALVSEWLDRVEAER